MDKDLPRQKPFRTKVAAASPGQALEPHKAVEQPDAETLSCLTPRPLSPIFPFPQIPGAQVKQPRVFPLVSCNTVRGWMYYLLDCPSLGKTNDRRKKG
jgi:hypothetical protein